MSVGSPLLQIESSDSDSDVVPPTQPRRSVRSIQAKSDWARFSAVDIAAALTEAGIPFDAGLRKGDLVLLAHNAIGSPAVPVAAGLSGPVPAPAADPEEPEQPPRKRRAKARHVAPAPRGRPPSARPPATPAPATPALVAPATPQPILDAVLSLAASVRAIDSRIQALETRRPAPPSSSPPTAPPALASLQWPASLPAPSCSAAIPPAASAAVSLCALAVPVFSLASALPAPPLGRGFVAPSAVSISPQLRQNIIQGKDVNLASLLLPSPAVDRQLVDCGDVSVILKNSDPRLSKSLSFCDFVIAFGMYRNVLCSAFPDRRLELDTYLAMMADFNQRYGGTLFYQYHNSFSAKSASYISLYNSRLDWSVVDTELLVRHFSSQRSLSCNICSSHGHSASLCPQTVFSAPSVPATARGDGPVQGPSSKVRMPPSRKAAAGRKGGFCKEILASHPSTPINVSVLSYYLSAHPDSVFVDFLLTGLSQGFRVGVLSPLSDSYVARNLQSALAEPSVVSELLSKELNKGYILGPFSVPPFCPFRVNSLGVATRKYSGKKRLIFDMSSPHSDIWSSVNEMIPLEPFSLHYASVDNAICLIKIAGRGALLAKADITDAFKVMPIHPADWPLFCVKWQSNFYFAVRLTFGCRSSPHIFNCLSEALCWILLNVCRLPFVLHLLDDFLLIDFPAGSSSGLDVLRAVFLELGVPLSAEKTLGPVHSLEFLGIILDSVAMRASLPGEKLARIREVSASFLSVGTVTKRDLLSLLGHLNFAMRIIPQGRSFISRLLILAHSVVNLSDPVVLDLGCQSDLGFWSKLLAEWNGISFFYNDHSDSSVSLELFTDAAPSLGFGGLYKDAWFAERWSDEFMAFASDAASSALFELYPIVVACVLWGTHWSRKCITFFCDNEAVVAS
ncbi:uncharacterized protein LOC121684588 [Alosa sapidissima]|uniref:uncharacterized protein LOC121684588 n=1 Tax=Alosa sapidissima TaxID=34773 RepID=UPI001C09306C|nr:uncharacterized protein LOC121684588 [Alosa sapidissima]